MSNDSSKPFRQPRGIVKIGGSTFNADGSSHTTSPPMHMPGWTEWEVENNAFSAADTFRVSLAVAGLPDNRTEDWFASQQEINVEIFAGFPTDPERFGAGELTSLIYGLTDEVEFDPVARVIHLSGRDLTAKMIDTRNTHLWLNKVSSTVATDLAKKYGLNAVVTQTESKIGKYYDHVNANIQREHSDWDLLTWLARREKYVVYVSGHDLHFGPKADAVTAEPYILQWQDSPFAFNGTSLNFSRSLNLARGVQVTVKSFHQRHGTLSRSYPASMNGNAQQYNYNIPNLHSEQAYQRAKALHAEIAQHEVQLSAALPADNELTVANVISVVGTGTAYDQKYYPDAIVRRMSPDGGYTMNISGKNHSPQTEVPTI